MDPAQALYAQMVARDVCVLERETRSLRQVVLVLAAVVISTLAVGTGYYLGQSSTLPPDQRTFPGSDRSSYSRVLRISRDGVEFSDQQPPQANRNPGGDYRTIQSVDGRFVTPDRAVDGEGPDVGRPELAAPKQDRRTVGNDQRVEGPGPSPQRAVLPTPSVQLRGTK